MCTFVTLPCQNTCLFNEFSNKWAIKQSFNDRLAFFLLSFRKLKVSNDSTNSEAQVKLTSKVVNPPSSLLEFQPLAIYLNAVLQCFNEFRQCAPLSLFDKISYELRESLRHLAKFVETYFKKEKASLDKNEIELFQCFVSMLAYELVPFLERCLLLLFPLGQLQQTLKVPPREMDKLGQCLKVDFPNVLASIRELILPPQDSVEKVLSTSEINTTDVNPTSENLTKPK